jgi:hypothetical protein
VEPREPGTRGPGPGTQRPGAGELLGGVRDLPDLAREPYDPMLELPDKVRELPEPVRRWALFPDFHIRINFVFIEINRRGLLDTGLFGTHVRKQSQTAEAAGAKQK